MNTNIRKIIGLVIASLCMGYLTLMSFGFILMSPMMFDSPGSENSVVLRIIVASFVLYPVVTIFGVVKGRLYRKSHKKFRKSLGLICLGLGYLCILGVCTIFLR